jgi:hypothetical protein
MDTAESKNPGMHRNFHRENREIPRVSGLPSGKPERRENASGGKAGVHVRGKSDDSIVPTKRSNKTGTPAAEIAEGRESPEGKAARTLLVPDTEPDHTTHRTAGLRQVAGIGSRPSSPKGGAV